jgi:hypothetical protein
MPSPGPSSVGRPLAAPLFNHLIRCVGIGFFYFGFFNFFLEMNVPETYFQVLVLSSRAKPARARLLMWRHVTLVRLAWLLCVIGRRHLFLFLHLFLSSSFSPLFVVVPLMILEFPPLLEARGGSNQLHELVP